MNTLLIIVIVLWLASVVLVAGLLLGAETMDDSS